MNKVIISGRTTTDIELKQTQSGYTVARFNLAVDRRGGDGTDFVSVTAWNKTAELLSKYVAKGNKVGIIGRIQTGSYEKNGQRVYTTDVVAEEVEFMENKKREQKPEQKPEPPVDAFINIDDDVELPFV